MKELTRLIKVVRSLLNDIDDMKAPRPFDAHSSDHWFGPFSEVAEDYDFNTNVNWPNLGIAARDVDEALHDYVRGADPRGPTPPEVVLEQIYEVVHAWLHDTSYEYDDNRTLHRIHKMLVANGVPISEHDPEKCGCKYIGMNMWDCGHTDGEPPVPGPDPGYSEY